MLVQQMVRYLHQLKELRVMLKLDIALAFDSVSWALFEVLHHVARVWTVFPGVDGDPHFFEQQ